MAQNKKSNRKNIRNFLNKRSTDYREYGRYLVSDFDFRTIWLRLFGILGDIVMMLCPMLLWIYLFLLINAGISNIRLIYACMPVVLILVVIFSVFGNVYLSILLKGQSFGKLCMKLKLVDQDNKELETSKVIIREVLGKNIPLLVLFFLFGVLGVLSFFVVDGLFVLIDPKHRSWIDFLLKTKIVMLDEEGKKDVLVQTERIVDPISMEQSENRFDLRLFSSFSHDGEFEVEDLFKQAKVIGLEVISICDHNSVKANLIAKQLSKLYDIKYIDGITIDCDYKGVSTRLIGYGVNSSDMRFAHIENENLAKEKAVSQRRVQLFEQTTGLHIDNEQLLKHSRFQVVTPVMIAHYILSNVNYQNESILQPYLKGEKKEHPMSCFVEDFFAPGKAAYVPIVHPRLDDMIAAIKASGGVCVLAHPMHTFRYQEELVEEVIGLGIDGLEVFNPRQNVEDVKYLLTLAHAHHLQVSEGSEYHGKSRRHFILGKTGCPRGSEAIVERFVDQFEFE